MKKNIIIWIVVCLFFSVSVLAGNFSDTGEKTLNGTVVVDGDLVTKTFQTVTPALAWYYTSGHYQTGGMGINATSGSDNKAQNVTTRMNGTLSVYFSGDSTSNRCALRSENNVNGWQAMIGRDGTASPTDRIRYIFRGGAWQTSSVPIPSPGQWLKLWIVVNETSVKLYAYENRSLVDSAVVSSIYNFNMFRLDADVGTSGSCYFDTLNFTHDETNFNYVVPVTYTYSQGFEKYIYNHFPTNYYFNISGGNISSSTNAVIYFNEVPHNATSLGFYDGTAHFSYTLTPNLAVSNASSINHNWSINISSSEDYQINNAGQFLWNVVVNNCSSGIGGHPIFNMSYVDELTGNPITVNNLYDFTIWDGYNYYNQIGNFKSKTFNSFCTNVDPVNSTFSWYLWGDILGLTKTLYATRIFTFDQGSPLTLSNNPVTQQEFSLILLNSSSSVTYNWITTENQPIDGTLKIRKCLGNGTYVLIESVPIIYGIATANINLLDTPYSYELIIDGESFTNFDSYSRCHLESSTEITYYVDVLQSDLDEKIGLFTVGCNINKTGVDTFKMNWGINPSNSDPITGCVIAYRYNLGKLIQIYKNCTSSSNYIERTMPDDLKDFDYTVRGTLNQSGFSAYCSDELFFFKKNESAASFGLSAVLAAIILVASSIFFFKADGVGQVVGAIVGFIASFILGILVLSWGVVISIVGFAVLIVVIGRYSQQ